MRKQNLESRTINFLADALQVLSETRPLDIDEVIRRGVQAGTKIIELWFGLHTNPKVNIRVIRPLKVFEYFNTY